jgi:hypothetical protein
VALGYDPNSKFCCEGARMRALTGRPSCFARLICWNSRAPKGLCRCFIELIPIVIFTSVSSTKLEAACRFSPAIMIAATADREAPRLSQRRVQHVPRASCLVHITPDSQYTIRGWLHGCLGLILRFVPLPQGTTVIAHRRLRAVGSVSRLQCSVSCNALRVSSLVRR